MHLPYSPRPCRLASPSHARRAERCYFPRQHSTPLIWLAWPATAVRVHASSTCLLEAHARSSQTHKDCIVSSPRDFCHLPWSAQQSSLILPVFTNRPFSCSSNPASRSFVRQTLRNSSLRARHCCTASSSSWEILHTKALLRNTRRRAQRASTNINQQSSQHTDCSPAFENRQLSASL